MPRPILLAAALLLATLSAGPPASAETRATARAVPPGTHIDWSHARDGAMRYRSGAMTLSIDGMPDAEVAEISRPVVTVELPGHESVRVEGSLVPGTYEHRLTVGRWDAERPFLLFQSFSGGAHCCNLIQLVYPDQGRLRVVELGEFDGDYLDALPGDLDGDGRVDFVLADNSFLYAFASYADSWGPPQVLNVVDGRVVDVSDDPGFRSLFEAELPEARADCMSSQTNPNGACAAFVAIAARAGRFDSAWAEMLRSYDRDADWPLPPACRSSPADGDCPESDRIDFDDYPAALRRFLIDHGYVSH